MALTPKIVAALFAPGRQIPTIPAQPENVRDGSLTLIKDDGTIVEVRCTRWTSTKTEQVYSCTPNDNIFYSEDHKQALIVHSKYLSTTHLPLPQNLATVVETVQKNDLDTRISTLRESLLSKRASAELHTKEKEQRIATLKNRVFNVIVGALITPLEIVTGMVRIAIATSYIARAALAGGIAKIQSLRRANLKEIELAKKRASNLRSSATRQLRVALLQFVPIIGAQLANQYKKTGNLAKFIDSPAVGGLFNTLLLTHKLTIPHMVYGDFTIPFQIYEGRIDHRSWLDMIAAHTWDEGRPLDTEMDRKKFELLMNYFHLPSPTVDDAKAELEAHRYPLTLVRIPVKTSDGKVRYHDATMKFSPANGGSISAKTVLMYHPNGGSRLENQHPYDEQYLAQGYNILYASYAGDDFIKGTGKSFEQGRSSCSEKAMIEDAEADIAFLQAINIKEIGIYGFSLGGAQAMNSARAAASTGLKVDFLTLNKTFSNGIEVSGRLVRNLTGSRFLERLVNSWAARFFAEEPDKAPECDGLDTIAKLHLIHNKEPFKGTRFSIIGGYEDELMGERGNLTINFARELFSEIKALVGDRASLTMESTGHRTSPDDL